MKRNLKQTLAALLLVLLLCALCGCGQPKAAPETPAPSAEQEIKVEAPSAEQGDSEEAPSAEQGSEEDVQRYVGLTVEDFIAAYGEPLSSEYAPSCLGPGEDGTHGFEAYTVYTYKENGVETIRIIVPVA